MEPLAPASLKLRRAEYCCKLTLVEPLTNKIRPQTLKDFVGQEHLVGRGQTHRRLGAGPIAKGYSGKTSFFLHPLGPSRYGQDDDSQDICAGGECAHLRAVGCLGGQGRHQENNRRTRTRSLEGRPKVLFSTRSTASTRPSRTSSCPMSNLAG